MFDSAADVPLKYFDDDFGDTNFGLDELGFPLTDEGDGGLREQYRRLFGGDHGRSSAEDAPGDAHGWPDDTGHLTHGISDTLPEALPEGSRGAPGGDDGGALGPAVPWGVLRSILNEAVQSMSRATKASAGSAERLFGRLSAAMCLAGPERVRRWALEDASVLQELMEGISHAMVSRSECRLLLRSPYAGD